MAARREGFDVLMLREDRAEVSRSHMRGERRREADELLHLQLLDLGLLSQARTHTPRVSPRAHTTRCTRTVHGAPRAPLPGTSPPTAAIPLAGLLASAPAPPARPPRPPPHASRPPHPTQPPPSHPPPTHTALRRRTCGRRLRVDLRQVGAGRLRLRLRLPRHLPLVPAAALLLVLARPVPQLRGVRQPGGRRRGVHWARLPHRPRPAPRAAGEPHPAPRPRPTTDPRPHPHPSPSLFLTPALYPSPRPHPSADPRAHPRADHRPPGVRRVQQAKGRPVREPFRVFMAAARRHSHCVPFADHPLGATMYDAPVVDVDYATPATTRPQEVCRAAAPAAAASAAGREGGGGGGGGEGGGVWLPSAAGWTTPRSRRRAQRLTAAVLKQAPPTMAT